MAFVPSDSTAFALLLAGTLTVTYFAARNMFRGHDPREPPLATQSIPLIGHIIGLTKSFSNYYVDLSRQSDAPIFTMSLPGQKMYVITKPEFMQMAQKRHKVLAFPPVEAKFAVAMCGVSKEAQAIVADNVNGDDGAHGLSMATYAVIHAALHPGTALDEMNRSMITEVARTMDKLQPVNGETRKIGLETWLREALTTATTRSVYGPMNPYDNKEMADAFWVYKDGITALLTGILPGITARKSIAARAKIAKAFVDYYKAGGMYKGSFWAHARHKVLSEHKVPLEDIALFEVGGGIGLLVNTVPSSFWTLFHLQSHPGLLQAVRQELEDCIVTTTGDAGETVKTIDITTLKDRCPLLLSAYQESLRFHSTSISVREVMEDTYVDKYLLKKGAMLQMPARIVHEDASLWGSTAYEPRRFLPTERKNRPKDMCFRAFGGGKTLCPGRHFATNEILAVVSVWIARFDTSPVGGEWKAPTTGRTSVATTMMEPDYDVEVEVKTREGLEGVKWQVRLDATGKTYAMVTEDMTGEEE